LLHVIGWGLGLDFVPECAGGGKKAKEGRGVGKDETVVAAFGFCRMGFVGFHGFCCMCCREFGGVCGFECLFHTVLKDGESIFYIISGYRGGLESAAIGKREWY
jgi:hypothetical protein